MVNLMVSLALIAIIGQSIYRIIASKRRGIKCIGCPLSSNCGSNKCAPHQ